MAGDLGSGLAPPLELRQATWLAETGAHRHTRNPGLNEEATEVGSSAVAAQVVRIQLQLQVTQQVGTKVLASGAQVEDRLIQLPYCKRLHHHLL